jgi:type II restriction enzyme
MSIDLANYRIQAPKAVRAFWRKRAGAQCKQLASGKADQGERSGVTAGNNMNGFLDLFKDVVRRNGLEHADICINRRLLTLPGFFRPTKLWDLLVLNKGCLVAAIELKSQVGPSFGNNFNNRTEEAIGTAIDFWTAYREGAFGESARPFLGWLMLVEDCGRSRSSVRDGSSHFPLFREFEGASYAERYNILCRKLVHEQLYTAASVLVSPRSAIKTGVYSELSNTTNLKTLVTTLAGHVAAEAARTN